MTYERPANGTANITGSLAAAGATDHPPAPTHRGCAVKTSLNYYILHGPTTVFSSDRAQPQSMLALILTLQFLLKNT